MGVTLGDLPRPAGAAHRPKRVGRGSGSGHGKTSCRGSKGQKARSGSRRNPGFEGGQTPLYRRLPKRGFTSRSPRETQIVNLARLNQFPDGSVVTPRSLEAAGLVRDAKQPVKILGEGTLERRLTVQAHRFSRSAGEAITQRGGRAEVVAR